LNKPLRSDVDLDFLLLELLLTVTVREEYELLIGARSERERAGTCGHVPAEHSEIERACNALPDVLLRVERQSGSAPIPAVLQLLL